MPRDRSRIVPALLLATLLAGWVVAPVAHRVDHALRWITSHSGPTGDGVGEHDTGGVASAHQCPLVVQVFAGVAASTAASRSVPPTTLLPVPPVAFLGGVPLSAAAPRGPPIGV